MKKILSFILVAVLCLGIFTGCELLDKFFPSEQPDPTPNVTYNLPKAAEFLTTTTNVGSSKTEDGVIITQNDYTVLGQVRIAGVLYTVDWTVDNSLVKLVDNDTEWLVDVTSDSEEEYRYTLTATITAGDGTTTTVTFERHVNAYNLSSFEEYMNAVQDDVVTVEGIVVAMNSKGAGNSRNHLFLADANVTGGYYIYQMDVDPVEAGIKVGMTVSVTGPVSPYSGMQEIKGGTATIIDSTIKNVDTLDITDEFAAGASLKNYVGLIVTVKGVTIGSQDLSTSSSQYLYFELNGQKGYVRTYITDFPTTLEIVKNEDTTVSSKDKDAIDAAHAAHFGWTANATGILILYNGNPYLVPVSTDCFEYLEFVEKTAEEKIAAELDGLTFEANYSSDAVVDLLTAGKNYNDVVISWTSDNAAITIADGKATIVVPETAVTVKLTATLTCGDKSETKVFEVKLSKSITPIDKIIEIAKGLEDKGPTTTDKYLVAGIVTEVKNTTYGNLYITDANGNKLYVYGCYSADGSTRYDKMENAPQVGDYIVVLSVVGHYNEPQLKNAWVLTHVSASSVEDINTVGNALENKGPATEDKYLVTGEITEIKNDTYGNLYIKDAEGNTLYVYGLYSADGSTRYDKMEVKPAVGDTITILGVISNYNGVQIKNAWVLGHTVKAEGGEEEPQGPITSITDAAAAADGAAVVLTGTVTEDDNNNSVTIVDADGKTMYIYKLATPVAVGDNITVTGVMGTYKETRQVAQGATAVINTAHTCSYGEATCIVKELCTLCGAEKAGSELAAHTWVDATCTSAKYCSVCFTTEGEKLAHSYTDGKCACGVAEGQSIVVVNFAVFAPANNLQDTKMVNTINADANVTFTAGSNNANVSYGNNTGKYYYSDNTWRIYQADAPELTIAVAEGKTIKSVKVTYTAKNDGTLAIGETHVEADALVEVNGSSVTFTVINNGASEKTNGQVLITAIEVIYE